MGCGKSKQNIQETADDTQSTIPERKIILIGDSAVGKTAIIH
jgi:GTPase SAR1 family protein